MSSADMQALREMDGVEDEMKRGLNANPQQVLKMI